MTNTRKKVLLTGATGNMGREAVAQIALKSDALDLRVLVRPQERAHPVVKDILRKKSAEIAWGDLTDYASIEDAVRGADVVLHVGGLVSPLADNLPPEQVTSVNVGGITNIVEAIRRVGDPETTRLVYIGTVAETGNRNAPIHWGRCGDPIKLSVFDHYAVTKTRAEAIVAESGLRHWVSLRQSGMVHHQMWQIVDPIMFHTPINGVFEWATAHDSGRLMAAVCADDVPSEFWRGFYNIGGGEGARTVNHEFLGRMTPRYREMLAPHWFATQNFHGQWYADSDRLEELVPFRELSLDGWFEQVPGRTPWAARFFPKHLPGLVGKRLGSMAKGPGGTLEWFANDRRDKIAAYFGSREAWEALPRSWDDVEFTRPDREPTLLDHGYDTSLDPSDWTLGVLQDAAAFRGGQCLATAFEGPYTPVDWESSGGHRFSMTPNLFLRGGHWCPADMLDPSTYAEVATRNPFFAQVWTQEAER